VKSTPPLPAPFIPDASAGRRLRERMQQFSHAMANGNARDIFLSWQASRDALGAAVQIIGDPAGPADEAAARLFNNGATPWEL
jgi:hypothetical protein